MNRFSAREFYARILQESEDQARRDAQKPSYRSCPATAHLHADYHRTCDDCLGTFCAKLVARGLNDEGQPLPYNARPTCGALIRIGAICANRVIPGKAKCHLHGGKSTGPKTAAGKASISAAQRRRWAVYRATKTKGNGVPPPDAGSG
jgi:hypothetical protein